MTRFMRVLMVVLVATALAAALSACAGRPAQPVVLTQKDSGSTQALSAGQQMKISLEANPTTGYRWDVDGELPPQLERVGEPTYMAGSPAIGAGGTEVWTFAAASAGRAQLKMKYWRSFEPTVAPVATFDVTVDVK